MWLVTQFLGSEEENERILDLLLKISPDLYRPEKSLTGEGFIFIHLAKVTQYWRLDALNDSSHSLKEMLCTLAQKEKIAFTLAPSAPWGYFLLHSSPPSSYLSIHTREQCQSVAQNLSPSMSSHFVADLLSGSGSTLRSEWNFFTESLDTLGFKNLGSFLDFCQDPQHLSSVTERLGLLPKKIFERLRFKDDFPLKLYTPSLQLKQFFYPDLEKQIDSPMKADILERLHDILEEWQERLRLRKSLIKGFEVVLVSHKSRRRKNLCLALPSPTREAKSLFKLLQEKWMSSTNNFSDPESDLKSHVFEEVHIYSLGLQFESDRQLHLFDPKREDRQEEWSLLIGTLQSLGSDVRIGHYTAHTSYWPEFSVQWQSWSESNFISFVEDHPQRPLILLSPPKTFTQATFTNEDEFLNFLVTQNSLSSLERISDPWRGEERSYARFKEEWIFWDHKKKRCFVHGYMDPNLSV